MRIHRVRLQDVRGIDACEVEFDPRGITVVAAPNESGKSTLVDAIRLVLNERRRARATAQEVKDLQPVGRQVGSVVEVELAVGDHHLVVRRRYNQQPEEVLRIVAPTSEQLTGDEAHDRLAEILREHVDVGLLDALWLQQGRDLDALALGQTSLSARLDAATSGGTTTAGSSGGDDLLSRVEEHHARWFTATGREKVELTRLDDRVAQLRVAADELRGRLAEVEAESVELAEVERTLPAIERELAERLGPSLESVREQRRSLETLEANRETLRARLEQATTALDAARDTLERRRAAAEALSALAERVATVEQGLQPADDERAELTERRRRAQEAAQSAEETLRSARRDAELAQWRVDLLEAREAHAGLEGRLARARALIEGAGQAQEQVDASLVDDEVLAALRDADASVRTLEARVDAGAPTVRLRARTALAGDVDGDAFELADGDTLERAVHEHLRLRVSGLDLEVLAGDTASSVRDQLARARRDLADRCGRAGVADLDEAERQIAQRRIHEQTLRQRDALLERELEGSSVGDLAEAVEASRARLDQLAARRPATSGATPAAVPDDTPGDTPDGSEPPSLAEARRIRDERAQAVDVADGAHQQASSELDVATDLIDAARERHDEERRELDGLRQTLERDREQLERERAARSDDDLASAFTEATRAHHDASSALREADARLVELDPERVDLAESAARNAYDAALEELARLRQRRTELTVRIATVGAEGLGERLTETAAELERAELDQRRERQRAAAARLLRDELHTAREEVHRAYRAPLRDRIVRMSSLLLGEDVAIELDDDLRIATRTSGGATLAWHQLSAGAREQLAILTALSAAQLAGDDGVPFILDDALGYTDPQRMATLGALLGRTEGAQVIVLTCTPERFRTTGARTVSLLPS